MDLTFLVFHVILIHCAGSNPTPNPTDSSNDEICSGHSSCYDCVGMFAEDGNCHWCPSSGHCEGSGGDMADGKIFAAFRDISLN